jgi:hypothetical protein
MTRTTNARVAGVTFLVYIAAGVAPMAIAVGPVAGLALSFIGCFSALMLGVTLYALTRDEDPDLALFAMVCRVAEGILGAIFISSRLALGSLRSPASVGSTAQPIEAIGTFVRSARSLNVTVGATFFALGSAVFAWLLLRARMVPPVLGWLGVLASLLLVLSLPAQLAGVLPSTLASLIWLPMLVFELWLALWLILKKQ